MGAHVKTEGFFIDCGGSKMAGKVILSFTSDVTHETLSFSFEEMGQITLNYLPVHMLVRRAREIFDYSLCKIKKPITGYIPFRIDAPGLYSNAAEGEYLRHGQVLIQYKANTFTGVLSLAFEDKGAISVPIEPIEALILLERRRLEMALET